MATFCAAVLALFVSHLSNGDARSDSVQVDVAGVTATASGGAATVRFLTSVSTRATVRIGVDETYGLFLPLKPARKHSVRIDGLRPATRYVFRIDVVNGSAAGSFTTSPTAKAPVAAVRDGVVRVDGASFFPVLSWAQCAGTVEDSLALGVNVFMSSCSDPLSVANAIGGRAYLVPALGTALAADGILGAHQPDEPEGYGVPPEVLLQPPTSGLTFMTLSPHFARSAAPPPGGKELYPFYLAKANVIGFDLYPYGKFCRNQQISLATVFDWQRELVALAPGKPTFQWIETNGLEGECPPPLPQINPARLNAQIWLAIAGGAKGLGLFTWRVRDVWTPFWVEEAIRQEIAQQTKRISALQPALLAPATASWRPRLSPLRVGARRYAGSIYVIAVNPTEERQVGSFSVPGVGSSRLGVWQESRVVHANKGVVQDAFEPLAVHVYVSLPA